MTQFTQRSLLIHYSIDQVNRDFHDFWSELIFELKKKYVVTENRLWPEENIMTLMYFNNINFFNIKQFDVWTHTDNYKSLFGETSKETKNEYFQKNKSFHEVLEEMNN